MKSPAQSFHHWSLSCFDFFDFFLSVWSLSHFFLFFFFSGGGVGEKGRKKRRKDRRVLWKRTVREGEAEEGLTRNKAVEEVHTGFLLHFFFFFIFFLINQMAPSKGVLKRASFHRLFFFKKRKLKAKGEPKAAFKLFFFF
jgi:hypothetical protein